MTVSYHIKLQTSEKNQRALAVVYDWQSIALRTFKSKGIDPDPLLIRTCGPDEEKDEHTPFWRIRFIAYQQFEGLLNDELKCMECETDPTITNWPDFFHKLLKLRGEYGWLFKDDKFIITPEQQQRMNLQQFSPGDQLTLKININQ